jgi:P-type Ca2+ transporter type 2C
MMSCMSEALSPHALDAETVVDVLETDAERGLLAKEARARLDRDGPNELQDAPPVPRWRRFAAQFADPLVALLLAATAISAIVWLLEGSHGLPIEAIVILAIVVLNAVLGYVQESRAEAAVAALRALTKVGATVVRDGQPHEVAAPDLVRGDLMLLEAGDVVAADGRLVRSVSLSTAEGPLTGESEPVDKRVEPVDEDDQIGDRTDMVYRGTVVSFGRGAAVVTATGMGTELGKIAGLLATVEEQATPLQREIARVGRVIGIAVIAVAVVVIGSLLVVSDIHDTQQLIDVMLIGVSLAVAAVPEGLATILTVVLALGVQRMAKRNAIIRKLSAVETLGSATTICSDKTGTLTRNEMTVREAVTAAGAVRLGGTGFDPTGPHPTGEAADGEPPEGASEDLRRLLGAAALASNATIDEDADGWRVQGDPTEGALIVAARNVGTGGDGARRRFPRVDEVPFSSERKLMSTVHADARRPDERRVFTKGAPDVLLARCSGERKGDEVVPLSPERRAAILASVEDLAMRAMRTLAVAERRIPAEAYTGPGEHLEDELTFLGVVGMIDPPRAEAAASVAAAQAAGVRVLMITGDHPATARAIAAELDIAPPDGVVCTGVQLERMDDDALAVAVAEIAVYARVSPEHKLRIVRALQGGGQVVAMTGDGVNDAPALKTADIGVAMGITGTDVSKEASDMVLTDDRFATIVAAIEEGRSIFANIRKFIRYLLSSNTGEVMTMFFGIVFGTALGLRSDLGIVTPLLATQILWINLLTDAAPALAVGVDPAQAGLMQRPPRPPEARVIDGPMWVSIGLNGFAMAAATLFVLDLQLPGGLVEGVGDERLARTMAFTVLVLAQLVNVFNSRSDHRSAFHGLFSNPLLWAAVALSALLQVAVVYLPFLNSAFRTVPLTAAEWATALVAASVVLWVSEGRKLLVKASTSIAG